MKAKRNKPTLKWLRIAAVVVLSIVIIGEVAAITLKKSAVDNSAKIEPEPMQEQIETEEQKQPEPDTERTRIVVLDPGHGKSSSQMTEEEKTEYGWKKYNGQWGEWRHYKLESGTIDCGGGGCNGRAMPNASCWYPITNGDRSIEPDINLQNALAAKKYLWNPSITRRLEYCFPGMDRSNAPDADIFVCIHSNAGGGSGTAYIEARGPYDQAWINEDYEESCNHLGRLCNDYIISNSSISSNGNGVITYEPELIAFCKSPVPCGYLEIGFFDNATDRAILQSESDNIGMGIALGIDAYFKGI